MTSFRMRPRRSSTATRQSPSISTASGDEDLLDESSPSRIPYQHARSSQPLQRLWLGALAAARYTRRAAARTQRGAEDRTRDGGLASYVRSAKRRQPTRT